MDKDRIEGAAKQAKGALKEAAGKALGDSKLVEVPGCDELPEVERGRLECVITSSLGGPADTCKFPFQRHGGVLGAAPGGRMPVCGHGGTCRPEWFGLSFGS